MQKYFFLQCILSILAGGMAFHTYGLSAPGVSGKLERHRQLTEKIDSLEVERQIKRRDSLPLEEIELAAARLRDSLKELRCEIGQAAKATPHPPSSKFPMPKRFFSKPSTLLDWILIGVGGLAVCAGIVALFVYLAVQSRRRRRNQRPPSPRGIARQAVAGYSAARPASLKTPGEETVKSESIRSTRLQPAMPEPAIPSAPSSGPSPVQPKTVDDLIITAYKEGLDVSEISKRYHISADQAALIVKMAKLTKRP